MEKAMRRIKLKAQARVLLFSLANLLVPGGMPFGLVDRHAEAAD